MCDRHLLTQVEVQTVACQSDHLSKYCRHPHTVYSDPRKFGKNWPEKRIRRKREREVMRMLACWARSVALSRSLERRLLSFLRSKEHVGCRVELPSHDTDL